MIQEDYVSFEVAKLLKEKGFNEPCRACYIYEKIFYYDYCSTNFELRDNIISAPTHQMAMKWLREVHNINIEIYVVKNYDKKICEYSYTIMDLDIQGSDDGIDCCHNYKTYEQACEESIKYCLEHLI